MFSQKCSTNVANSERKVEIDKLRMTNNYFEIRQTVKKIPLASIKHILRFKTMGSYLTYIWWVGLLARKRLKMLLLSRVYLFWSPQFLTWSKSMCLKCAFCPRGNCGLINRKTRENGNPLQCSWLRGLTIGFIWVWTHGLGAPDVHYFRPSADGS